MSRKITKFEKVIGKRVSETMRDYELDRFSSMPLKALLTRVGKITTPIKVEACRQFAFDSGWTREGNWIDLDCKKVYYACRSKLLTMNRKKYARRLDKIS